MSALFLAFFILIIAGTNVSSAEDFNKYLLPVALQLKDAVLKKRVDILLTYAPGNLYDVKSGILPDETYKFIYDSKWVSQYISGGKSVYDIFKASQKIAILFEPYYVSINDGKDVVVRAYYYDPQLIDLKLPLTAEQRQQWMKSFVTCRFKFIPARGWRVAYTLFDDETDGP